MVERVHTAGAFLVFFSGTVFTVIDAILTVLLPRQQHNRRVVNVAVRCCGWLRIILAVIAVANVIVGKFVFCFNPSQVVFMFCFLKIIL